MPRNLTNTMIDNDGRNLTNTTTTNELINEIAELRILIANLVARVAVLESG